MGTDDTMNAATATDTRAVRLSIPAKPEYITLGRLALTAIGRLQELPEETLGDLKLALTEACTNSVRHAYEHGEGCVEILYELHPDRLAVEVTDEGPGFTAPDREIGDGADLSEGGLGIAIIRALTDEFDLADGADGGSRLRFVKYLALPGVTS
jgi:serine/threonine-protein kinase RsbW